MKNSFKALVVEETSEGSFSRGVRQWSVEELPENEVLIEVQYSSLNYKDALSATGNKGVTKKYPHTPGIDAAGTVAESRDDRFQKGDTVLVTGYDLGQNTPGGFGQYIRVPGDWIVPLPDSLTARESMIIGTAGFTAAIGIHHLQHNDVQTSDGPILVTGATGGVGTMAVTMLANIGYKVTAATGKMDKESYLKELGASSVIHRNEVQDESSRPLLSSRWAGAIDTVGGIMLDTAIRQTKLHGTVACCGNVLGHELHTNVYPFILRGIHLAGMDSGNCPMSMRKDLWRKLATSWKPDKLEKMAKERSLEELNKEIDRILKGEQVGRILVNLSA